MSRNEEDTSMMRKRTTNITRDISIDSQNPAHDYEIKPHPKRMRQLLSCGRFLLVTGLLSMFGLLLLAISGIDPAPSNFVSHKIESSSVPSTHASNAAVTTQDWSQCAAYVPKSNARMKAANKTEPLWLPAYPTSLPGKTGGAIYSGFLSALTGIDSASRNYYRSSKKLKRCHYIDDPNDKGITCEIVHPIVPCERPHPSAQSANFGKVVLVAIRNPITAFPAYHQEKAEKYHNTNGQVDKSEWVTFRDQWVGNATHNPLFDEWKKFVVEWRDMSPYSVSLYLPHEWWPDEVKGLILIKQLTEVLKNEGLPVMFKTTTYTHPGKPSDLECMWYKKVRELMIAEEKNRIEEGWYTPDYQPEQRQLLAVELTKFAAQVSEGDSRPGDEQLLAILNEYRDSILSSKS
ncbi:hypothetical protein ACHAWO_003265 [Cyclotella atomus]|uniref:Sulfotransferase domain-containing protein n=1 Tax=Cyclotella atomus TaxID=382360 RepID=A0ABD3P711_9STRA